ncbi:uncharacterized protein Triagg1_10282 [Trichoderma aggressivum f. europaeum]|uniref:SSCRP protein n=1 Tax=Trichoderma aggressivum f. europaeum TaxID=173218 RepID=A0AAE1I5X2_9HYPO|nr:hypothetical protein Triagg1_10282 [Trichoderma aggressivum f. europaeum]
MRYTAVLTVLGLTFSGAMANNNFGPFGFFGPWFDGDFDIDDLADFRFPENPCEFVGGTCEATTLGFCSGRGDFSVDLPCGGRGIIGVGCCWHRDTSNAWFEQWKEWLERHRRHH